MTFVNSIQRLCHDRTLSTMISRVSKGLIRTEDDSKNASIRGGIVNTVTSWFRREDRFLFLPFFFFFLERFRSSEGKKASVEKAGGGACASTHHRGSALRRGGTTPGVVSSAACAVTLARSSFTSRAHSHVAARTFRLSFSLKISLRLTPFPNVSRSTRRKRNTVIEELFLPFTTRTQCVLRQ